MASGSFGVSTSNGYISGNINWSESSQNSSADTSVVYAEMRLSRTNSGYTSYGTDTFWININGTQISNTLSYSITQNSNTLMVSGSVTVTHNADGSKSITISWGGGGGGSGVFTVNSSSGTATLDTLPRASTLATSNPTWTAGTQNLPLSLNVASSSFHHTIQIYVQHTSDGNYDYVGQRTSIGSSTTWVFTESEVQQLYTTNNMYENRPVIVRIYTYDSSGNQIGAYQDATGQVNAVATATTTLGTNGSFNIGTSIAYSINNFTSALNSVGTFYYDVTLAGGGFSKTWSNLSAQSGTLTLTSTDVTNLYAATPNSNTLSMTCTTRTKYDTIYTEDGVPTSHDVTATANVTNSNPTFTGGFTYADTNSTTTGVTGNNQYIVQNQSTLTVTLPSTAKATANNGASMSYYVASIGGVSVQQPYSSSATVTLTVGKVNVSSNATLSVIAYDSRGNSTTATATVNILAYSPPAVTTTSSRSNGFDVTTNITCSGSFSTLTISGSPKNALTVVQYSFKKTTDGSYGTPVNFTYTTSSGTFSATTANPNDGVTGGLDNAVSWNTQVVVTDKLTTTTIVNTVNAGVPLMFIDGTKKSVGIGKFPTGTGTFETAGNATIGGNLTASGKIYFPSPVTDGDSSELHVPVAMQDDGGAINIPLGTDWNTMKRTGLYRMNSNVNSPVISTTNPDTTNGWWYLQVFVHDTSWGIQIAYDYRDGTYLRRWWDNSGTVTWDSWRRITDERRHLVSVSQDGQGIAANTWTRVDFNPVINDAGIYNDSTNMFAITDSGWYEISASMKLNISINTAVDLQIWGNPSATSIFSYQMSNNGWNFMYGSDVIYLNTGTNYQFVIQHNDTGYTRNIYSGKATIKRI
jgi:hypothetical protein